ncbi:hypothetical protein L4X37_20640, partial [Phocaeicola vulgatus]|nr:hypothetical protein [Phocaeicola vulgatus]
MDIRKENQYNQSMGKYKILSTAAGVGSIITTKWGGFIMPLSINNWKFVEVVSNKIKEIQSQTLNIQKIQEECGVELIEDPRFVDFLNVKKGFTQLKCFVAIPHIQLNSFNQIQRKGNPLYESILKSATKLFSVLLASKRPLITELADKLRLKYPLLPTISPCP